MAQAWARIIDGESQLPLEVRRIKKRDRSIEAKQKQAGDSPPTLMPLKRMEPRHAFYLAENFNLRSRDQFDEAQQGQDDRNQDGIDCPYGNNSERSKQREECFGSVN